MSGPAGTKFPKISKHNGSSQGVTFLEISKQVLELYNTRTLKKESRQKGIGHGHRVYDRVIRSRSCQCCLRGCDATSGHKNGSLGITVAIHLLRVKRKMVHE